MSVASSILYNEYNFVAAFAMASLLANGPSGDFFSRLGALN